MSFAAKQICVEGSGARAVTAKVANTPALPVRVRQDAEYTEALFRQINHWKTIQPDLPHSDKDIPRVAFAATRLEILRALEALARQGTLEALTETMQVARKKVPLVSGLPIQAKMVSLLLRLGRSEQPDSVFVYSSDLSQNFVWPLAAAAMETLFTAAHEDQLIPGPKQYWIKPMLIVSYSGALADLLSVKVIKGSSTKPAWTSKHQQAVEGFRLICDAMRISAPRFGPIKPSLRRTPNTMPQADSVILPSESLFPDEFVPKDPPHEARPDNKAPLRCYLVLVWQRASDGSIVVEQLGDALPGGHRMARHAIGRLMGQSIEKCRGFWGEVKETDRQRRERKLENYRQENNGEDPPITSPPVSESVELERRTGVILPMVWLEHAAASTGDGDFARKALSQAIQALKVKRGSGDCIKGRAALVFSQSDTGSVDWEAIRIEYSAVLERRRIDAEIGSNRQKKRVFRLKDWRKNFFASADPQDWFCFGF